MNDTVEKNVTQMGETTFADQITSDQTSQSALLNLYAAIHQPDQYWPSLEALHGLYSDDLDDDLLEDHAQGVQKLMEQTLVSTLPAAGNDSDWSLSFDQTGRIFSVGQSVRNLWPERTLDKIWDLPLDADNIKRLRVFLRSRTQSDLVFVLPGTSEDVSRIVQISRSTVGDLHKFEIQRLSLGSGAKEVFSDNFDVSPAQFKVLADLVEGHSIKAIARCQNRSIETVRSHVKALFQKLAVRGQAELVLRSLSVPGAARSVSKLTERYKTIRDKGTDRHIQYATFGDPEGQPVLYFHQATDGPNITHHFDTVLKDAGLLLIGIARPGVAGTCRQSRYRDTYLKETAEAYQRVAQSVAGRVDTLLAVGTGLPHALAFAQRFEPRAKIIATNPFPAMTTRQICRSLPGRWRNFGLMALRSTSLVQAFTLLAYRVFRIHPEKQAEAILRDEITRPIPDEVRLDIVQTLTANLTLSAVHRAAHFRSEAEIIRQDWVATARDVCPHVTLMLLQGTGHFTLHEDLFASLARELPNAEIVPYTKPNDPIHLLDPETICHLLMTTR